MVKIRKRENESSGSLLRRFTKALQLSGFLERAKKNRHRQRSKSDYAKKKEALRRIDWEREMRRLRKLGKAA